MTRHHVVHGFLAVLVFVVIMEGVFLTPEWFAVVVMLGLLGVGVVVLFLLGTITVDFHK